jgi:hypothetical protein
MATVQLGVLEQQQTGARDDGNESGVVRTELVRGTLVTMPMLRTAYSVNAVGSTSPSISAAFPENGDGTQSGIFISVAASASLANSALIGFWIMGEVFGLRLSKSGGYFTANPVGCRIDGVAYDVAVDLARDPVTNGMAFIGTTPGVLSQIIATDLGSGPHYVELIFPAFLSGATRQYGLLGYLVDSRVGNVAPARGVTLNLPQIGPAAITWVNVCNPTLAFQGIRKVFVMNTTATAIIVLLRWNSSVNEFWRRTVPANDTLECDLGGILYDVLQVYAAATGINVAAVGAA